MHANPEFDSPKLKPSKYLDRLVETLPSFSRDFKLFTPEETKFLRARSQQLVREFRAAHNHEYGSSAIFREHEVHHIVPLCLGGGVTRENLSLVDHDFHSAIHRYINRQMRGMEFGEIREINIPILDGTIWHRPQTPTHTPHSVMRGVVPRNLNAFDHLGPEAGLRMV